MKDYEEIIDALKAGETLVFENRVHIKLKDGHLYNIKRKCRDMWKFDQPCDWEIYTKPEWYESIPEGGVLCWVRDTSGLAFNKYPETVINYCDDSTHFFETPNESWMCAKPLTKQEVQVFLDNAPE